MNPAKRPQPEQNNSKLYETLSMINLIVENQGVFTDAEFRLATIIVKSGGHREGVVVSDRTWKSWTRRSGRCLEIALRGLKEKGISVEGKGDRARFRFNPVAFETFIRKTQPEKPRVQQKRKPILAKPGMEIHPDCQTGCQRLCDQSKKCTVVAIDSAPKVSGTVPEPEQLGSQRNENSAPRHPGADLRTDPLPSRNSQPSERAGSRSAQQPNWPLTLATMRSHFLTAGESFLTDLLKKLPADVSDAELAQVLKITRKPHQKSEMLWLKTVPDALKNLRIELARSRQEPEPSYVSKLTFEQLISERDQETHRDLKAILDAEIARRRSVAPAPAKK